MSEAGRSFDGLWSALLPVGRDPRIEQGRGLVDVGAPVGVASAIWPHGRWRVEVRGEANHAGTTRFADRRDPMPAVAELVLRARAAAAARWRRSAGSRSSRARPIRCRRPCGPGWTRGHPTRRRWRRW